MRRIFNIYDASNNRYETLVDGYNIIRIVKYLADSEIPRTITLEQTPTAVKEQILAHLDD